MISFANFKCFIVYKCSHGFQLESLHDMVSNIQFRCLSCTPHSSKHLHQDPQRNGSSWTQTPIQCWPVYSHMFTSLSYIGKYESWTKPFVWSKAYHFVIQVFAIFSCISHKNNISHNVKWYKKLVNSGITEGVLGKKMPCLLIKHFRQSWSKTNFTLT